jgi:membrane fusion protein (multidrug efflux system)
MKRILPWLSLAALVAGCNKKETASPPGGAAVPPTQVIAVPARQQPVSQSLSLVGTITANEMVEIKSETEGTIAEILFQEGQTVKKGDPLFKLDERKSAAAVAEAEANFQLSNATFNRIKQLLHDKLISQQEFDQAAAQFQALQASLDSKKQQWQDTQIHASFSGTMGARQVSIGQVINKSITLTWLVDLDPVKAEVPVPERFLGQLHTGQTIELVAAAFPGEKFKGEVYFIAPQVEPNTRTALIKARIANTDHRLKPGMFASLDLTLKLKDNAIVIPESAVMSSGERTIIYVIDPEQNAQIRSVTLGVRLPGLVEVVTGLRVGEPVITEGVQKIRPGAKVKAASPVEPVEQAGERGSEGGGSQTPLGQGARSKGTL